MKCHIWKGWVFLCKCTWRLKKAFVWSAWGKVMSFNVNSVNIRLTNRPSSLTMKQYMLRLNEVSVVSVNINKHPEKIICLDMIESKHQETPKYFCDQCEYKSWDYSNYKVHTKVKHGSDIHKCQECDYQSKSSSSKEMHNLKHNHTLPLAKQENIKTC